MRGTNYSFGEVLRTNAVFFLLFLMFLLIGAALLFNIEQGDAILYFNDWRGSGADIFFYYVNWLGDGLVFVPAVLAMLFYRYRFAATLPFLGVSVSFFTQSAKRLFAHPRPFAYFKDLHLTDSLVPVEGVPLHGGMNSFPSGHTMTAFALFAFLALCLPYKRTLGALFFVLALLAGIARIYLAQHFLKDVYLGAVMGVALALFWYLLQYRVWPPPHRRMDGALI